MLFHSPVFLAFSILLLGLLALFQQQNPRKGILLIASYVFYMWWNPAFILLIIFSTLIDYTAGQQLYQAASEPKRKQWLIISLCSNLGMLAFFKYFGFFEENLLAVMQLMGYEPSWTSLNIILPVGISFYTFQTMSYTIDIYRRDLEPCRSILDFGVYVAFFPQLVAGPIVRARDFLPQIQQPMRFDFSTEHFLLILKGLVKKVLIADNLAILVQGVYAAPETYPSIIIWLAAICFSVQIYCDFSGYTDMAIGIAAILGFRFPQNFNRPYFAKSPSDFWRRWHISLSSWLRDYLYISLGGNRNGKWKTYRNLFLTMALGGLWHGASWNYVVWGVLHGLILIIYRWFDLDRRIRNFSQPMKIIWATIVMQYFVLLSWISFRITDFEKMLLVMKKFIFIDFQVQIQDLGLGRLSFFSTVMLLAFFWIMHSWSYWKGGIDERWKDKGPVFIGLVCVVVSMVLYFGWPLGETPFIYFQF